MPSIQEGRVPRAQIVVTCVLLLMFCTLLVYRFTFRSEADNERIRARVMLQSIYELEQAQFEEVGTYLRIDRENYGEILKLKDPQGRFQYRVVVAGTTFVAYAEANPDKDGRAEVWWVDPQNPNPVLQSQD
ncbi:MAG: hypothetical protein O2954_15610 [bacterium]|nr:hypothetical protein [bacterium]